MKITMLGSGAWGTALANLLCENGHDVTLWNRSERRVREMAQTRINSRLKDAVLHPNMSFSSEVSCVSACDMVVFATPSFAVRQTASSRVLQTSSSGKPIHQPKWLRSSLLLTASSATSSL